MTTLAMDGVLCSRAPLNPLLDLRQTALAVVAQPQPIPTPLDVLARSQAIPVPRREVAWRPAVAFGLVAVALAASGTATVRATVNLDQTNLVRTASKTPQGVKLPAAIPVVPNNQRLQSLLNNFTAANRSNWGIVVTNLKTGETASVNPTVSMTSASLYKLYVAKAIYAAIDKGQLSYSQAAGGGSGMDIQDCLSYMITISDNTCGRALGTLVGWNALNPGLVSQGYTGTDMANPIQQTSPHDVALLLQQLYQNKLNSPASNAAFMSLLKQQKVNNRLPQGLPAGTVIAHKTGDLYGYTHDAGIVYGPKSNYLVVVMSGSWSDPADEAPQFAQLSSQLWSYFEN